MSQYPEIADLVTRAVAGIDENREKTGAAYFEVLADSEPDLNLVEGLYFAKRESPARHALTQVLAAPVGEAEIRMILQLAGAGAAMLRQRREMDEAGREERAR